eukprot:TRINITY_DN9592_c0_g1_i1.p1 TRINITY_DN9592_c0_g1~~TRINITY_DN9592_c0_g1_i1.p1  ORF type:complete len:513 (-),score=78.98 TRINITY_DN9592_c0_g1_i1:89-1441(-)
MKNGDACTPRHHQTTYKSTASQMRASGHHRPNDGAHGNVTSRQLEHRLEDDRRHLDQKIQRVERRLEELVSATEAGGRWAELQGYVDGLGLTVQELVRRLEVPGPGPNEMQGLADVKRKMVAFDERLKGLESQSAQAMKGLERGGGGRNGSGRLCESGRDASLEAIELARRLDEMECRVEGNIHELWEQVRSFAHLAQSCAAQQEQQPTNTGHSCASEVGEHSVRLSSIEQRIDALAAGTPNRAPSVEVDQRMPRGHRNDMCSNDGWMEERGVDQVASLRYEMEERCEHLQQQVTEISSCMQEMDRGLRETEQGLHDLWMDQRVRQQVSQVGEQMMRFTLKDRGNANAWQPGLRGDGSDVALGHVQGEVGALGDELGSLQSRMHGVEHGLESMATALSRVCEEVAGLRCRGSAVTLAGSSASDAGGGARGKGAARRVLSGDNVGVDSVGE